MVDLFCEQLGAYPIGDNDREWFRAWIKTYGEFGRADDSVRVEVLRELAIAFDPKLQVSCTKMKYRTTDFQVRRVFNGQGCRLVLFSYAIA